MTEVTGPTPKSPWGGRFTEPADASARGVHRLPALRPPALAPRHPGQRGLGPGPGQGRRPRRRRSSTRSSAGSPRCGGRSRPAPSRTGIELEDIHMNIERRLIEKIGAVGGKLHTGRSRNDQIALDMRLWLRGEIDAIRLALREVQAALVEQAERHADRRRCRDTPTSSGRSRSCWPTTSWRTCSCWPGTASGFADARRRLDVCPLGAAALAGTTVPIDRHALAQALGFSRPDAEQHGRRVGPRLRARVLRGSSDPGHPPVPARRGARAVGLGRVRLRRAPRRLRHRVVDHAAEEEPGRRRADPGKDGAGATATWSGSSP